MQNYSDGVNKELSLHYQSFYMEAMGLMMRLLVKNKISVPKNWKPTLKKMCSYMADCMGDYGEMMVFGDDDEGKILDLQGGFNHYQYVLGLFSFLLDEQYINLHKVGNENLNWLFSTEDCNIALSKSLYQVPLDGEPSQTNAHPHVSGNCNRSGSGAVESEVVGVHNGIIENYTELKEKLLKHGYTFYSQTDTEVVIKLVDYYYRKYNLGPIDAIAKTMVRVL